MHFDTTTAAAQQVELYLGSATAFTPLIYSYAAGVGGFRFDNNSFVYTIINGASSLISGDRWGTPRTGLGALTQYEIRWHEANILSNLVNETPQPSTGWDEATWLDLATDRQILYSGTGTTPYGNQEIIVPESLGATITLNIELRFGDGTPDPRNTLTSVVDGDAYAALGFYVIQLGTGL